MTLRYYKDAPGTKEIEELHISSYTHSEVHRLQGWDCSELHEETKRRPILTQDISN